MDAVVRSGQQEELTAAAPTDTIFALATGAPPSAIAIIRVSGPAAWEAAAELAGPNPSARIASYRRFHDPVSGEALDRGLLLLFPEGHSVTGEACAEFQVHGSRAVVDAMLRALGTIPHCRLARAGEFTWRAFQHGRMDLSMVEGLGDLLAAETESQRRAAARIAEGGLSAKVAAWRTELLACAALIEAALDFSDEQDVGEIDIQERLGAVSREMQYLLDRPSSERLHGGIEVVIAGPPNAGKSTLLNALVGREAAITSSNAGTTRDLIQVPATIGDVAVRLTDSAGLRLHTDDEVEAIGIARASNAVHAADIILWLGDEPPPRPAIWLHARSDVPGRGERPSGPDVTVSAKTGQGLQELATMIVKRAETLIPAEDTISLNARQRHQVAAACDALVDDHPRDPLLLAERIRQALLALDRLRGAVYADEMLDQLFSRFCIGK